MKRLSRKRAVASACATDEEQLRGEGKHVAAEAAAASHADAAAAPNSAMTNTDLAISSRMHIAIAIAMHLAHALYLPPIVKIFNAV